jgi:predicted DCC family thiol-disulfide oxidoreductase YuxK
MTATPILYDPDCGFCRICVAAILKWDRAGRLRPMPLGSAAANDLLRGMPEDEQMASWHLVQPGWLPDPAETADFSNHPEIRSGGAGFSVLFRLLPGGTPFALVAERFPKGADKAYRSVADRRGAFGRVVPRPVRRWADRVIRASESAPDSR